MPRRLVASGNTSRGSQAGRPINEARERLRLSDELPGDRATSRALANMLGERGVAGSIELGKIGLEHLVEHR